MCLFYQQYSFERAIIEEKHLTDFFLFNSSAIFAETHY